MAIHISDLKLWQEWARQDNALQLFCPSDIREMLGEIERLRASLGEVHTVLDREIAGATETLQMDLTPAARQSADGWLNAAKGIKIAMKKKWPC